jgi:hypothetical protein
MTTAQLEELEQLVLGILRQAEEPLSLPQIQERLVAAGRGLVDSWYINRAVWQLIHKRLADFTPRRDVKALPS